MLKGTNTEHASACKRRSRAVWFPLGNNRRLWSSTYYTKRTRSVQTKRTWSSRRRSQCRNGWKMDDSVSTRYQLTSIRQTLMTRRTMTRETLLEFGRLHRLGPGCAVTPRTSTAYYRSEETVNCFQNYVFSAERRTSTVGTGWTVSQKSVTGWWMDSTVFATKESLNTSP